MKNLIVMQFIPIIFIETIRAIIGIKNRNNKLILVIMTTIIILLEINYKEIILLLHNKREIFKYICSTIIPIITCNILYTYLAIKNLYTFTLIIRIISKILIFLYPKTLDINWFTSGSFKIIFSAIVYYIAKYKFTKERIDLRKRKNKFFEKTGYIVTICFSIILVCFMLGFFKYRPISIMSNSMFPLYKKGDVVIFRKVENKELEKIPNGAILIYSVGKRNIAHRIINSVKNDGKIAYQTKGDNNKTADINLVKTDQILGVYVFHIKYIGLPSIWLYEYFNFK